MERYQRALEPQPGSTEDRIANCLELGDPELAGDCAHAVVHWAVTRSDGDPIVLCPQVPAGLWRAECWFEAAEATKRKSKQRALELCDRADPFRDDCQQHLWQGQLKAMVDRSGPHGFAQQLAPAQALHDTWAALLPDNPDHSLRFWRRFYQAGLGGMIPLDLAVCEHLPDIHRERCLEAGVAGWLEHLEQANLDPKKNAVICSDAGDSDLMEHFAIIGLPVQALSHPRLELAATEFRQDSCIQLQRGSLHP